MRPTDDLVLFDAFETLGSEAAASPSDRFVDFRVYESARPLLFSLRERARLGVLCADSAVPPQRLGELLVAKELVPPLDPDLIAVLGRDEVGSLDQVPALFSTAPERIVWVSLDAGHRRRALAAGMRVAPHPALTAAVLAGESLHFVELRPAAPGSTAEPAWEALLSDLALVPMLRSRTPTPTLFAITSRGALESLAAPAFGPPLAVEVLGGGEIVSGSTLVLLQLTPEQVDADPSLGEFISSLDGRDLPLVRQTPVGWLVALPGGRSLEELHPPPAGAGHGHTNLLVPVSLRPPPAGRPRIEPRDLKVNEWSALGELGGNGLRDRAGSWLRALGAPEDPS